MLVKILSVEQNATIAKRSGGSYNGTEVTFKNIDPGSQFAGKIETKGFHESVITNDRTGIVAKVHALEEGDEVELVRVKNETTGFLDWVDIGAPGSVKVVAKTASGIPAKKYTASSTEKTPDVQAAIIRQNALTNAVSLTVGLKLAASSADVIKLAKELEAYTSGKVVEEVKIAVVKPVVKATKAAVVHDDDFGDLE